MANVIEFSLKVKDQLTGGLGKVRTAINKVGGSIKTQIAAAGGVTALAVAYQKTANEIDRVAKNAAKLGRLPQEIAITDEAARRSGVSLNTMNMALQRMTRRVSEAAIGTGEAQEALKELNLNAAQLNKLTPDKKLQAISAAMSEVEDQSDRVRLAFKLFDSEGVALVNTLNLTQQEMEEIKSDVIGVGAALTMLDVSKVEQANDAVERLGLIIRGGMQQAVIELAPFVKAVADEIFNMAKEAGGLGPTFVSVVQTMVDGGAKIADIWRGIQIAIQVVKVAVNGFKAGFLTALELIDQAIAPVSRTILQGLVSPVQLVLDAMGKFNDEAKEAAVGLRRWTNIQPSEELPKWANEARLAVIETNKALHDLMMQPLPSTQVEQFVARVRESVAQMEAAAAGAGGREDVEVTGSVVGGAETNDLFAQSLTERLEILRENLATERELSQEQADEEWILLNDALNNKLLLEEEYNELIERAELEHQARMGDIVARAKLQGLEFEKKTNAQKVAITIKSGADILGSVAGTNKALFNLNKAFAIADTAVSLPNAIMESWERAGGYPWGIIPAGLMAAKGAALISQISGQSFGGQAHAGLDFVPTEGTFLLDRGERVISPEQNRDLTNFLDEEGEGGGPSVIIEKLEVFPNVTNAQALLDMDQDAMKQIVQEKIIGALDELAVIGVRPNRMLRI